jgi:hypothetical protein
MFRSKSGFFQFLNVTFRLYKLKIQVSFRLMVFNATFNNISVISGGQFYWWRKSEKTQRKPHICRKSLTNFIT